MSDASDPSSPAFTTWLGERRASIDALLDARLPAAARAHDPGRLVESVRYSLLAPGKRLRPVLAMAAAEAIGATMDQPIRVAAAAVELVHCYSLVHDDLPAMDDDDVRRGRPTNHKVFGDAIAILAGDALLTLAFEWIAQAGEDAARDRVSRGLDFLRASHALARGAGLSGMVRGQARDLGESAPQTPADADTLHAEKTGALFRAALEVGAHAAGADAKSLHALARFGDAYGLAFQHADDLADGEHPALADHARARLRTTTDEAIAALAGWGPAADPLRALARALGQSAG